MDREPAGRPGRHTTVRRTGWALIAILLGLLAVSAPPARAQDDGGAVVLEATAGLAGRVGFSRSYPVVVDVAAPRLLSGTLRLTANTEMGRDVIQRPIEVAGGTTKRFVLVVGSSNGFGGDDVRVDVVANGRTVATARPGVVADGSEELVGVLPSLAAGLDRDVAPLAVDLGQARLGAIPAEVVAEGPLALAVYDQIAATAGDIDDLSDVDQASLTQWVGNGGHLLLDSGDAAAVLPAGFDPAPGVAKVIGFGKVRLTAGALAAGRWQEVLLPTPVQSQSEEEILSSGLMISGDVASSLAAEAGFDVPSIKTLLLVLAAYVVVVGPIAWFAVRRRRTTLLWGIVPAVALVTTGLVQLAGSEFRQSDDAVHVTMIETSAGGAIATTSVFVAGQGDATTVDLPRGWRASTNPFFGGFGFMGSEPLPSTRLGEGSQVAINPGVGGASIVRARGPVELDGGLLVTATSDTDGLMRGTVENTLDVDLVDVAILISRATVIDVGDVPAGATAEWETDNATHFEFGSEPEAQVWPYDLDASQFGFTDGGAFDPRTGEPIDPSTVEDLGTLASSLSAYGDVLAQRGSNFKPTGQAVAVGWTRSMDAPLRVGGTTVANGRTGIVGRGEVQSVAGRLVDTGSVRQLVRGPGSSGVMAPNDEAPPPLGGTAVAVWAFNLPSQVGERAVDPARLELHISGLFKRVQVWANGSWQELGAGEADVRLPAGAVIGQTVFVRAELGVDAAPGPGREFVLYEVAA